MNYEVAECYHSGMTTGEIVQQLKQHRSRLDTAIQALQGTEGHGKRRGRPAGSPDRSAKRRTMSTAARKRISAAMKARWAKWKKAQK